MLIQAVYAEGTQHEANSFGGEFRMRKKDLLELIPLVVIVAILSTMLIPVLCALTTHGSLSQGASEGTRVAIVEAPAATGAGCPSGETVRAAASLPATSH